VLLFTVVVALDKFGFQIAPLVAGIGVAGLGLGFALQGVLSNVVAGLTIIFTKPFRVGEHIEIVGVRGDVTTIELFSTTLVHPDRSRIIIPNRKIVGEILHNFGTLRQLHLGVMVPHGADLSKALSTAREVVTAGPRGSGSVSRGRPDRERGDSSCREALGSGSRRGQYGERALPGARGALPRRGYRRAARATRDSYARECVGEVGGGS